MARETSHIYYPALYRKGLLPKQTIRPTPVHLQTMSLHVCRAEPESHCEVAADSGLESSSAEAQTDQASPMYCSTPP